MHKPESRDYGAMPLNRAERRRIDHMNRRHDGGVVVERPSPEPVKVGTAPAAARVTMMHKADMEIASRYRGKCDRAAKRGGDGAGFTEALSMMVGCFAFLVGHHDIEKATKMMGGALSDMAGQALIKRAADIKAGKREPFKAGELA